MIRFPFYKGMAFHDHVCTDKVYIERWITLACRNGLDPFKTVKKLNEGAGKEVCKLHTGKLVEYEEVGPERMVIVSGFENVETHMTIARVKFEDGLEAWVYRFEGAIDPRDFGKKKTRH